MPPSLVSEIERRYSTPEGYFAYLKFLSQIIPVNESYVSETTRNYDLPSSSTQYQVDPSYEHSQTVSHSNNTFFINDFHNIQKYWEQIKHACDQEHEVFQVETTKKYLAQIWYLKMVKLNRFIAILLRQFDIILDPFELWRFLSLHDCVEIHYGHQYIDYERIKID